jgi:uncharacterized protein (TIGR03118 family)
MTPNHKLISTYKVYTGKMCSDCNKHNSDRRCGSHKRRCHSHDSCRSSSRCKQNSYTEVDLVSNIPGRAMFTDPNLVNAWGLSHSPTGPWWVSDNGTGVATIYQGNGTAESLIVTIAPPAGMSGPAAPTGNVFNDAATTRPTEFVITKGLNSAPAIFLFATEDGTVSGWNPTVDPTNTILAIDNSTTVPSAVYKGITIGMVGNTRYLYVTNFRTGLVEMYDTNFMLVKTFTDTSLSTECPLPNQCFAPFNVLARKGKLYVTFALQKPDHHDDDHAPSRGFVDVFSTDGTFIKRLISKGALNSPWAINFAPKNFGKFSCSLLVGNFGDGVINAYDRHSGKHLGALEDANGFTISINGLWGIAFGNDQQAGPANFLFFAAGINNEADGLFGYIMSNN